jgi:TRAP-type C4-dicarboxylate transport system substrate-binding protein
MTLFTPSRREFLLALSAALATPRAAHAQALPARLNLGTLAPRGSSFHLALQRMGEQWRAQGVKLVVYPDGAQGSEADMVRLMRVGTLQAGLFTAVGLAQIEPGISGLQNYPLLFRSFEELEFVTSKLEPLISQRLAAKGFVVLFWADAGWVRYFFSKPVTTPEQFRKQKIFVWSGSGEQFRILRELNYDPVQMETADILQGVATGQITGISVPPIFALISQFEKRLPHMIDLDWAPLIGACVVRKDVWDQLGAAQQAALQLAAHQAGAEIRARNRAESDQAVARMQAAGLTVHQVTAGQRAAWQAAAEIFQQRARGRTVPADIHDEVMRLLALYRSGSDT